MTRGSEGGHRGPHLFVEEIKIVEKGKKEEFQMRSH